MIPQCSSRCRIWPNSRSTASFRLNPHARRIASRARSRFPLNRSTFGACHSLCDCSGVSQLPTRTPSFLRPFTRRIPAARFGLSSPQSAASYASRRTAPSRRLIVPGAKRRDSRWIRYRRTTVLPNESRGSEQYHSTNSSIACRYPRWASLELRLFRTADFAWSRSGSRRTAFGVLRLRLEDCFFPIRRGPPGPQHDDGLDPQMSG